MIALTVVVTDSPASAVVVGLALVAVGMFIQYFIGLELDDRRDVAEQESQEDLEAVLVSLDLPFIPEQRDGGAL